MNNKTISRHSSKKSHPTKTPTLLSLGDPPLYHGLRRLTLTLTNPSKTLIPVNDPEEGDPFAPRRVKIMLKIDLDSDQLEA